MQISTFPSGQSYLNREIILKKTVEKFIFFIQNVSSACIICRLFFAMFLLSTGNLLAQPAIQWNKTFGGTGLDQFNSIHQTQDGGYILGGSSYSILSGDKSEDSKGSSDYWIVKLSSNGDKEWDKTLGGSGKDIFVSVRQANDGGYFVAGHSFSNAGGDKSEGNFGLNDLWIVKLDEAGALEWEKTIGTANNEFMSAMEVTEEGGLAIAATSSPETSEGTVSNHGWFVKLSATGDLEWSKDIFVSRTAPRLTCLALTSDGGYIVGADVAGIEATSGGYYIVKIASAGTIEWEKEIGGGDWKYSTLGTVRQTTDGGYILGGRSDGSVGEDKSEPSLNEDYWIVKVSGDGTIEWEKTIQGNGFEYFAGLQPTSDGGYLVAGHSDSTVEFDKTEDNIGVQNFWLVKLSSTGNIVWDKVIGGTNIDSARDLVKTADGGFLVAGVSDSPTGGNKTEESRGLTDFWIVKLGPEDPMPVTLTQFTAKKENNTVLLTWTTTSEIRSDRFEIQRSNNGKSWNVLGTVSAKGESKDLANYQYVDTNPVMSSENLYRLKMIDTDGTFSHSKINSLTFDSDLSVNMFPNPVSEILTIKMSDWKDVTDVQIINSQSAVVYYSTENPKKEVNVTRLSSGLYLLKITKLDGSYVSQKVVVAR